MRAVATTLVAIAASCGGTPPPAAPAEEGPASWREALPAGANLALYAAPARLAAHPSLSPDRALGHLGDDARALVETLEECGLPVNEMGEAVFARYDRHWVAAIRADGAGARARDCAERHAAKTGTTIEELSGGELGVAGEETRLWPASGSLLVVATSPREMALVRDSDVARLADRPGALGSGIRAGAGAAAWIATSPEVLGAFPGGLVQSADLQIHIADTTLRVRVHIGGADPSSGQALEAWALLTLRDAAPSLRERGFGFVADRAEVTRTRERIEVSLVLSPDEVARLMGGGATDLLDRDL